MLYRSRRFNNIVRLMGSKVELEEIPAILGEIKSRHGLSSDYGFFVDETPVLLQANTESSPEVIFSTAIEINPEEAKDKLLADIIMWALGRKDASGNAIDTEFGVGEKDGRKLIDNLCEKGIVSAKDKDKPRNPRHVCPTKIEDLTDDAIAFLEKHAYTGDDIANAFNNKNWLYSQSS